jgi:hypothetical protein
MLNKNCAHMSSCEMYDLFQLRGALRVWQINYCEGNYGRCARYQRAIAGQPMPSNLLPNGKLLTLETAVARAK